MNEAFTAALSSVFDPHALLVIAISAVYGIFVGSIPGLTATMAVALVVPMTLYLSDVEAVAAIVTTVTCSIFAGDIPSALVRIPGTPASAAYVADAYALTQRGRAAEGLGVSLLFSVLGGLTGVLVLICAAPQLAKLAAQFTSYEYFWLYLLGLTCAAVVSEDSRVKGALALLLGLLLSTIGFGTDYSAPRLTFGWDELATGINFIPAMIGLFGVSEVLRNALYLDLEPDGTRHRTSQPGHKQENVSQRPVSLLATVAPLAWRRKFHLLRSSVIGAFVGMLPGAGADIAAWISYAVSKRLSPTPEQYGHGSMEGLGDASGANNAALGGAWIPALVFGIPGDSVTAIAIGVLLMKNITPGPDIFDATKDMHQTTLVYSIYITFLLANLLLIPVGLVAIRAGTWLVHIPRAILLPVILVFCVVGSYALNASYFDVGVMLAMGVVGFSLERHHVPLGPVVLGILLGAPLEHKFIQCLMKSSSALAFVASPLSIALALAATALWLAPGMLSLVRRKIG
ncbi:MAG: tripartite tricarboxylate transporter permease [Pirellulales bacterium]